MVPSPRMVEHVASAGGRNFFEILDVQLVPEAAADPHSGEPDGGSLR